MIVQHRLWEVGVHKASLNAEEGAERTEEMGETALKECRVGGQGPSGT